MSSTDPAGEEPVLHIARPAVGDDEWRAMAAPIETGWLTQGPNVRAFEEAFAALHGSAHGIATTSCTTALHLILAALGIGPGDEVVVPSFTWVASANVVRQAGATPILVDVDPRTYVMRADEVRKGLSERTRAVMVVHLFGLCVNVDEIAEAIAEAVRLGACEGEVAIVEDAACAAGAAWRGRSAGSLGAAGAFSFHPRKTITTGEGGMVTTGDDALAQRLRTLRDHGATVSDEARHAGPAPWRMADFDEPAFNYRMTDLQGAMGLVQTEKLPGLVEERARLAALYEEGLADLDWLHAPAVPDGARHGWQAYVCRVDEETSPMPRNAIMEGLAARGIMTRPGTHAVHTLGAHRDSPRAETLEVSERLARETMAIPLHNHMKDADVRRVVEALRDVSRGTTA